jgi:hypothetical protein
MNNDEMLGEIARLRDKARMAREAAINADIYTQTRQEYEMAAELDAEANELELTINTRSAP